MNSFFLGVLMTRAYPFKMLPLLAVMVVCMIVLSFDKENQALAAFSGGSGTAMDPYLITTPGQLADVRNDLNAHYRLEADLDLSDYANWLPIGSGGAVQFTGVFDGNGHTISNLTINDTGNHLGLFGNVRGARIQNIGLINVNIAGDPGQSYFVGGLAGMMDASVIEFAYVTGTVAGQGQVGGLVGYMVGSGSNPSVINYSYAAAIVNGSDGVGGLVGHAEGNATANFSYWNLQLVSSSARGTGRTTAEMKMRGTFTDWNFSGEGSGQWGIVDSVTYPMHQAGYERLLLHELTVRADDVPVELEPAFSMEPRVYSVRVSGGVDQVTAAVYADSSSTVLFAGAASGPGLIHLIPGENIVHITVQSAGAAVPGAVDDPFEAIYTLVVVREDGSAAYPHRISSADQLAAIGTGPYGLDGHYVLMNDIDLAAAGYSSWDPIGSAGGPFTGFFDGGKHVIRNLTIHTAGVEPVGLFAESSGTVQYLGLENVAVTGGGAAGGAVGRHTGIVSNAYATGAVTGGEQAGGLIGLHEGGELVHAYFAGTIDGAAYVGGLIGQHTGGTVTSSYWDTEASGLSGSGGGTGKTTEEMYEASTYSGWDFTSTWAMMNGTTYPMWKRLFEEVELTGITVDPPAGTAVWDAAFAPGQGAYAVELDRYVETVDIAVAAAKPGATVTVNAAAGASAAVSVSPGRNEVEIAVSGEGGIARGVYRLVIDVPAPALTGIEAPADGYYRAGDTLTFIVSYEDAVAVAGMPRLPILAGGEPAYADYAGQPGGEASKLRFDYVVPAGVQDTDGIVLGAAIQLPDGASVTASGENAPLAFTAPDTSGVKLDAVEPAIHLSPSPETPTLDAVTVTATVADTGSGVDAVLWAAGSRTAAFFAGGGGNPLTGDSFQAEANGDYTVYARDVAGNEAVAVIAIANILPPVPALTGIEAPADGYYRAGDTLTFIVSYEDAVAVAGMPRLPILAGGEQAYADYAGQPGGEASKLRFDYVVPAGVQDTDGIVLGAAIQLPDGASVTASGENAPLAFTAPDTSGVKLDAVEPAIHLSPSPETPTLDAVTVTATVADTGSGVDAVLWAAGSRTAAFFAGGGGNPLTGDSFQAEANGDYTVYARDVAGNEAVAVIAIANILPLPGPHPPDDEDEDEHVEDWTAPDPVLSAPCQDGSCLYLRAGEAGEFAVGGMTVIIPQGATDKPMILTIEDVPAPLLPEDAALPVFLSPVFEVLKSTDGLFLKPVTLRIVIGNGDEESAFGLSATASIFYYNEDEQQWVELGNAAMEGYTMTAQVDHFTKFAVLALEEPEAKPADLQPFPDIRAHWALHSILEAARQGIVHGHPDGTFRPDEPVTRAQFAVMLMNGLRWTPQESQGLAFADASQIPSWSMPAIVAAVQNGVMSGYPDHTLRPHSWITRVEMTAMLVRILQIPYPEDPATLFQDDEEIPLWAKTFVAASAEAGLVQGDEQNRFRPAAGLTRAEAAVVVLRLLQLID